MTREIKFRGKDLETGEWVYGSLFQSLEQYPAIAKPKPTADGKLFYCLTVVDADTVGQYTGLKDRNGKEIYEGDIVKTPLLDLIIGDVLSDAFDNVAISFHNGSFVVAYYNGHHKIYLQDLYDEIEVIGNIHDNLKLLEERK